MSRLKNKTVIITGAAEGMGKVEAMLFAKEGAKIMVTDVQSAKLKKWVEGFRAKNSDVKIEYMEHDVSSEKDWNLVVQKTLKLFNNIDVLVNNAGIFPPFLSVEETTLAEWHKVIDTNLSGVFLGCKAVVPAMRKNGGGSIVNISSIAGMAGGAGAAYSSSKGGVRLASKDLAVELGQYQIRVNSIMPGAIETPMTAGLLGDPETKKKLRELSVLGRIGTAEEVAYGALFLASNEASFVTGADLVIDGGCLAKF
jgi:NAD(P)-dependent dehydrogenase (short-subunit alcohol dehydrogenase family)